MGLEGRTYGIHGMCSVVWLDPADYQLLYMTSNHLGSTFLLSEALLAGLYLRI